MNEAEAVSVPIIGHNESLLQPPAPRPDGDDSLQGLRHMSTIEMITTAFKYSKLEQLGESPLDAVAEDDVVRLMLPETSRWKRFLIRLHILWDEIQPHLARQIPWTLDNNRVGIQWTVGLLISTIPLYIEAISSQLQGAGVYIAINAVVMYEATHGGSFLKVTDRSLGTLCAYAIALIIFVPVYTSGYRLLSQNPWLRWAFYASAVAAAPLWGFIRYHTIKEHPTLQYGGLCASIALFAMVTEEWFWSMARIVGTTLIGIVIGTFVFRYVLPQSAAGCAQADLAKSLRLIARSLEPLLVFESGVVDSPSFFEKSMRLSSRALSRRLSSLHEIGVSRKSSRVYSDFEQREVSYILFQRFRDQVWNSVEATYKLLNRQEVLTRNARREFYGRKPHRFPADKYTDLVQSVHQLFFCATALYLGLDTRSAAVSSQTDRELFGDTWQLSGAVKILPRDSLETETKRVATHPASFNSLLARPRAELETIRAKFASDPRLFDPGPTLGSAPLAKRKAAVSSGDLTLTRPPLLSVTRRISPEKANAQQATVGSILLESSPDFSGRATPQPRGPRESLLSVGWTERVALDDRGSFFSSSQGYGRRSTLDSAGRSPMDLLRGESASPADSRMSFAGGGMLTPGWSTEQGKPKVNELTAVCQWVSVYGPLIGRVSRHVCTAIDAVARSLESRKLCAQVQDALLMAEDAVADFAQQRKHLRASLRDLCDEVLLSDTVAERREAAEMVLRQWMGIGLRDYDALSLEQKAHVWEVFSSMQDRLASTRAAIFGLTAQLEKVADKLRTFMRAMLLPVEDHRTKATTTT